MVMLELARFILIMQVFDEVNNGKVISIPQGVGVIEGMPYPKN